MEGGQEPGAQDVDLGAALGAGAGISAQCFTVYVPNKDRDDNEIGNQRKWVLEATRLLSEINGGATAMPPVEGGWLNDEGEIIWEEGCLSVIDYTAEVRRAAKVEVKAWTPDEQEITLQAEDLLAVALQHELDHLDGKLFLDRLSRLKRELYTRRVKKLLREGRPLEARKGPPAI